MENKAHALAAGLFIVVMAALLLALAAWLTRETGVSHVYEISTASKITGLQQEAPVRFRGVEVGKVARIGFDPKVQGNVLLRLEIDRAAPLTRNTFATLSYQGVTGLAFVQLDESAPGAPRLQPNDQVPPQIPLQPSLVAQLEERGVIILDQAEKLTVRLNQFLSAENERRFASAMGNIDQTAANANRLVQRLDATVTRRIDPVLAEAGSTLQSVRSVAADIGRTAADFGQVARQLNEEGGTMDRLADGAQGLAYATETLNTATLPRFNRLADEGARTVRQLGRTLNNLNENPQALIYGAGPAQPGPGEPGFKAPEGTP